MNLVSDPTRGAAQVGTTVTRDLRGFRDPEHGIPDAMARLTMKKKPASALLALTLAAASTACAFAAIGCGGGDSGGDPNVITTTVDPAAFTVSYRNRVRLPNESQQVTVDDFAKQLKLRDPVAPIRCLTDETKAFKDASEFLGGIKWSHPVTRIKDSSLPPLYEGRPEPVSGSSSGGGDRASAEGNAAGAPPVIERPDLVGIQNGVAIFLSKQHGLLAVDAKNPAAPNLSCSMKLPGDPKNFLFKGIEIVVVVNALNGMNRSALLRYALDGTKFRFVDSINLEGQTITDARLFDQTIVMYTSWSKTREAQKVQPYEPEKPGIEYGGSYSGGDYAGGAAGERASSSDMAAPGCYGCAGGAESLGTKVLVVQWDDALAIDWEDSLVNDPPREQVGEPKKDYKADELVSERKSYKGFVAASDRYIAVPRDVETTRFDRYETRTWQECTNYNPRAYQYEACSVQYEQRANPDYRAPNPSTGDYQCNGKNLADCVKEAAPSVSQYIYVPVGKKCEAVWQGRCEKYESRSSTYPTFKTTQETEMTIYRFEAGTFTKLDSTLGKLVEKPGTGNIAFESNPLKVTGQIQNRNQIQFQNGHLYVFGDQALQTMAVAGNSISYLNRLSIPSSTTANPSIVFSDDRAMISSRDIGGYNGGSDVSMLDLATPSFPKMLQAFRMPGQSSQLLLAAGGILGPGQVSFANQGMGRTLQKLTLFSREGGQELDNLLMGTEFDAFEQSWFNPEDDQRIRLSPALNRLFLPYSGRHHADDFAPTAHRLNVSRIDAGKIVSERSFQVPDEIIRTTSIDDNRSLAFANSAAYLIDRTSGDWAISTLRELFVPFATYRVNDANDLHVRIDRVGSKCKVTSHKGNSQIFAAEKNDKQPAELLVTCPDSGTTPVGWKSNIVFSGTRTVVKIGDNGELTEMTRPEVDAIIGAEPPKGYCWLPARADTKGVVLINYLDNTPMSAITCEQPKTTRN